MKYMRAGGKDYQSMTDEEVNTRLSQLNEKATQSAAREKLKTMETTRHWMIWHDHSGLGNSGVMLFLLRELYDPACHLTSSEYKEKHGSYVDIQSAIEEPYLYLMGLSGSSDAEQLKYISTRRECLIQLSEEVELNGM